MLSVHNLHLFQKLMTDVRAHIAAAHLLNFDVSLSPVISRAGEYCSRAPPPPNVEFPGKVFGLSFVPPSCYIPRMAEKLTIGFLRYRQNGCRTGSRIRQRRARQLQQIIGSDPLEASRAVFSKEIGAKTTASNPAVVKSARVLVLAVKPDQVPAVLVEIRGAFTPDHLLISIAAGVPLARLEDGLTIGARVIRVMPNTPALVGASAAAFALGKHATANDGKLAHKLFSAVGIAFLVKESLLDARDRLERQRTGVCLFVH